MCRFCSNDIVNELEEPLFTAEEMTLYVEAVYLGLITKESLSLDYHTRHSELLSKPIDDFLFDPDKDVKRDLARLFRTNVYEFSAAKQYQQVRELSQLITNDIEFEDFKAEALSVLREYNENYLRTEFNTAVAQSQNANFFTEAIEQAADFPYLQYKTQNDGLVRDAHRPLHNITKRVNDPFWKIYMPTNGWNCRCFVIQLEKGTETPNDKIDYDEINKDVPTLFRSNPALTGEIYDKRKHPYFEVEKGDTLLKERNFNLPRE